jgi:hypothetical protein
MLSGNSDPSSAAEAEREYRAALMANPFDATAECRLGEIAAKRTELDITRTH